MTCCVNPAVRWCLVLVVVFVGAVSLPGAGAGVNDARADENASPEFVDQGDAQPNVTNPADATATPPATVTGLPKDLSVLTRDELIDLVKDLTLQNQILAVRLAKQRDDLANAAPDLQARIDWQARTIDRLEAKLARSEANTEQVAPVPVTVSDAADMAAGSDPYDPADTAVAPEDTPAPPTAPAADATPPQVPAPPAVAAEAAPKWEYRFAYEFGLIRTSGEGHVTLRDENGKRQRHEYDYTEYRHDALWVKLLVRNDSPQPMRFSGLIELQGDKSYSSSNRERLASHAFRTPLLQPGEIFQLSENELLVDRPWKVDVVELTHVQAFSTPASPDPDPGSR